mmetsp:Transcript_13684/g.18735  ORF Transcript_13684/g.18735 Transcript_13684/m.18735 type:complete len:208 (-) Transcript_13684:101-724(-)
MVLVNVGGTINSSNRLSSWDNNFWASNASSSPFRSCRDPEPAADSASMAARSGTTSDFKFSRLSFAATKFAAGTALSNLLSYRDKSAFTLAISCLAKMILLVFKSTFAASTLFCISRISLFEIGNPYLSSDSASEFTLVPADEGALSLESARTGRLLLPIKVDSATEDATQNLTAWFILLKNDFGLESSLPKLVILNDPRCNMPHLL